MHFSRISGDVTELWIDCEVCAARYSAYSESCPTCGAANPYAGERSMKGIARAAVIGIAAIAIVAVVFMYPSIFNQKENPVGSAVTILRPPAVGPETVPKDELVKRMLDAINKDRREFGLAPVELSDNEAAQAHAEDVFKMKQISHWMSNGEKPYMTYTKMGGKGSVHQNVAIAGFGPDEYDRCVSTMILCERIDPAKALDELEHEMMYNDQECCDNGHRDNILDPHHTKVSIGIVYDEYYLALVQNFENDYGLEVEADDGYVNIVGDAPGDGARLDHIVVYYDEHPSPAAYQANKKMISYGAGELAASVFAPLPGGMRYQQPDTYTVIEAESWEDQDGAIDISFDLKPAINKDGVYTLYVMFKDAKGEQFDATSYSIFVRQQQQVSATGLQ